MTLYVDSSDLVKLYVEEPGSDDVQRLVATADVVTTSVVAYAEVRAALARKRREKLLTSAQCSAAVRQFDVDWPRFVTIPVKDDLGLAAGRLADANGIRGFDAIHLAAFEAVLSRAEDDVEFSCADERLTKAAKKLG